MRKLFIYQRVLPHYRVPFFEALHGSLLLKGVDLKVIYGNESQGTVPRTVEVDRPWAIFKKNAYFSILGKELVFQGWHCESLRFGSVVIVEQSNRLIINYLFWFFRLCGVIKLGLWGHGKNFQSSHPNGFLENFKRKFSMFFDWWFSYTERGKLILTEAGCPADMITVVNNSIDFGDFECFKQYSASEALDVGEFSVYLGEDVGIYCSGMYKEKDLPFLIESITLIKQQRKGFKMIFIGDGPESYVVSRFVQANDWSVWLGELSGQDRVKYFAYAKVFLMPGLVGLSILDSFASGVPLVTTDIDYHSPEIDYLDPNVNGLKVRHEVGVYAREVVRLLDDALFYESLVRGCDNSARIYSIENMVSNYVSGVEGLIGNIK